MLLTNRYFHIKRTYIPHPLHQSLCLLWALLNVKWMECSDNETKDTRFIFCIVAKLSRRIKRWRHGPAQARNLNFPRGFVHPALPLVTPWIQIAIRGFFIYNTHVILRPNLSGPYSLELTQQKDFRFEIFCTPLCKITILF